MTRTDKPARAQMTAALRPLGPLPTTVTSTSPLEPIDQHSLPPGRPTVVVDQSSPSPVCGGGTPHDGRPQQGQRRVDEPGDVDELLEGGNVVFGGSQHSVRIAIEDPGRQRGPAADLG